MHIQVNDNYLPPYVDYDNPDELGQGDPELTLYTQFYKAAVQLADNAERRDGRCHNCKETGHFWHECQQPLREEFKHLMDRTHQCQEELSFILVIKCVLRSRSSKKANCWCYALHMQHHYVICLFQHLTVTFGLSFKLNTRIKEIKHLKEIFLVMKLVVVDK